MKRTYFILQALLLAMLLSPARADAPTSQFGFKGWPYRQPVSCRASQAPTGSSASRPAPSPAPGGEKSPASPLSRADYTTTSVSMQEQKLWNLLNEDRSRNGLSALPLDEELSALARIKACDMNENRYFAHASPTYGTASEMLRHFGYSFRGVGENIAHHATVEKSQAAFMSSAGHRRNVLGRQWTRVGVGVCVDSRGFVYAVELFAR